MSELRILAEVKPNFFLIKGLVVWLITVKISDSTNKQKYYTLKPF